MKNIMVRLGGVIVVFTLSRHIFFILNEPNIYI